MRYSSFLDLITETARQVESGRTTDVAIDPKCGDAISDDFFGHRRMTRLGRAMTVKNRITTFTMRNVPVGPKGCGFLKRILSNRHGPRVLVLEDTTRDGTELAVP